MLDCFERRLWKGNLQELKQTKTFIILVACNLQTLKVSEVYSFSDDEDSVSDSSDLSPVSDVDDTDCVNV